MKPLLLGSLASATALMIWGALFWMVLPFSKAVLHGLPPEAAVIIPKLEQQLPETGVYLYPFPVEAATEAEQKAADELWLKRHAKGPLVQIIYRKEGVSPMSGGTFLWGFLHFFVIAALAGYLLQRAAPVLADYRARVLFVLLLGLFATVMVRVAEPIWFHHPWGYCLLLMTFDAGQAAIAGAILAAFIKPEVVAIV